MNFKIRWSYFIHSALAQKQPSRAPAVGKIHTARVWALPDREAKRKAPVQRHQRWSFEPGPSLYCVTSAL